MKKRYLIKQLKNLSRITPNTDWVQSNRDLLISQIKAQGVSSNVKPAEVQGFFTYIYGSLINLYKYSFNFFLSRPSALVLACLGIMFGGAVASQVAKDSLPGDALYSMKRTGESIQVAVTSGDNRPVVEMDLAGARLEELKKISFQIISSDEQAKKTEIAVNSMKDNLNAVSQHLDQIKTITEPKQILQITKTIDEKTNKYEKDLLQTKKQLNEVKDLGDKTEVVKQVAAALDTVEQANNKALEVMVEKAPSTSEQDVVDKLNEKIQKSEEQLKTIKTDTQALAKNSKVQISVIDAIYDKPDEAKKILEQAKESLDKKDFKATLTKLNQSKEIIKITEDKIEQVNIDLKTDEKANEQQTKPENNTQNTTENKDNTIEKK